MVKETGAGISYDVGLKLKEVGVKIIDIGGLGGTSWAAVEYYRALNRKDEVKARLGELFWNWGIPTAASLIEVLQVKGVDVIASGGLRNGLDLCKSIALGAKIGGMALPFLKIAMRGSTEDIIKFVETIRYEMKACMFLTGCRNVEELRGTNVVLMGELAEWVLVRFGHEKGRKMVEEMARRSNSF